MFPILTGLSGFTPACFSFGWYRALKARLTSTQAAFQLWVNLDDAPRPFVPSFDVADVESADDPWRQESAPTVRSRRKSFHVSIGRQTVIDPNLRIIG